MMMGQISILAVMALKQAFYHAAAMAPLLIFTHFFFKYLERRHYHAADFLPLKECCKIDECNLNNDDFSFLFEKYNHPVMKAKPVQPDNIDEFYSLRESQDGNQFDSLGET